MAVLTTLNITEKNHYMRWAYIEDLLPCKEEEGGGDNE